MEIFYLYSPELCANATLKFRTGKRWTNINVFKTESDAEHFLPFAEKLLGNSEIDIRKCKFDEYAREYGDVRQNYPKWLKEELVAEYQRLKSEDSSASIRKFAKAQGIKYYTFRDWFRDYKEE